MRILHAGYGFRPWRNGGLIEYAEDLMDAQVAQGDTVGYFFAGRQYPVLRRTRLKRWRRRGVQMFEVVDSPLFHGGDRGSFQPDLDLDEPHTEALFRETVAAFRPDVVHVQELAGLPSSLLAICTDELHLPVVMTLQDYYPLCPTLKLFDTDHATCGRSGPSLSEDCVTCCRRAPSSEKLLQSATTTYEWNRAKDLVPRPLVKLVRTQQARWMPARSSAPSAAASKDAQASSVSTNGATRLLANPLFETRRTVNLQRLRRVDLLIAQSRRVEELYRALNATNNNSCTINLTVRHLEALQPNRFPVIEGPVQFITLNGCYTRQKGAYLLLEAMQRLDEMGLGDRYQLSSWGGLATELEAQFRRFPNFSHGGWYKLPQLDAMLASTHVGIIPSTWEEAFGYVGLEYIAKGIPILGNARGGIVDYTREGETGWLNRSCSGEELAQKMASLIEHPKQINEINSRIIAQRSTLIKTMARHSEEMKELYESVCQRRVMSAASVGYGQGDGVTQAGLHSGI